MNKFMYAAKSAIIGLIITLATGLVVNTPYGLVGASWYGWPLTWLSKLVIAPQYNPWVINWYGLVIDFVFWSIVAAIAIYLACMFLVKSQKATSKGAAQSAQPAKQRKK